MASRQTLRRSSSGRRGNRVNPTVLTVSIGMVTGIGEEERPLASTLAARCSCWELPCAIVDWAIGRLTGVNIAPCCDEDRDIEGVGVVLEEI